MDQWALETAMGNEQHKALPCTAVLMSAGELTHAAFKARAQMSKHWEVYI